MTIRNDIFELLVTLFEAFVILRFNFSFHHFNYRKGKAKITYICCSVGFAAIVVLFNSITGFEGFLGIVYIIYLIIVSVIFLEGGIFGKLFSSALSILIILCVTVIVSNLFSAVFNEEIYSLYTTGSMSRIICVILVQALNFAIYDMILKVTKKGAVSMNAKEWILILSVFGISFSAIMLIHSTILSGQLNMVQGISLLIAEICLIFINIVCFYMTYELSKYHSETETLKITQQRYDLSVQYAETVKQQYNEMRMIRHDMRQNYAVLEGLLSDNRIESSLEYVRSRMNALATSEILIDVGNDRVNSIINSKLTLAKSKGIEIICSSRGNFVGIDDSDLCILLGNMLDNAIDSCICSEHRYIELKLVSDNDKTRILVSNTANSDAIENIRRDRTTKPDSDAHGFGLRSIRYIARKYAGAVNYSKEGNSIICQVIMYK